MYAKRILIAVLLAAGFAVSAHAAGFAKTAEYGENRFVDVPATEWYAPEVKSAYELGLMKGEGEGTFNPNGNVTVGEAVTMAARAAAIYAGETIDTNVTGEWYAPYVAYGVAKGFVTEGQFDNYERPAKRREVAVLFENAMPDGYFAAQNTVEKIPDVSQKQSYHDDLMTLYKAGVVMGSDSYGNFFPENNIIRAEAAAIINRVALPKNRLAKSLDKISDDDAYPLILTDNMNGTMEGINSGWVLDNRGGVPRTTVSESYATLFDIDKEAGTALIRDFNKIDSGYVRLKANLVVSSDDGAYLEYRNEADESVYRLELIGNEWKIRGADGAYTTVYTVKEDEKRFEITVEIDLDNARSVTCFGDTVCGAHPLAVSGEAANLMNFRIATTETSEAVVSVANVFAYVNYAVKGFDSLAWTGFGESAVLQTDPLDAANPVLALTNGGAVTASFVPVSGKVIAETEVRLPGKTPVAFALKSGGKTVASFSNDEKAFYINGVSVYEGYYENVRYRLRFELDTDAQTVLVKLNGRKVGELPFAERATSVDNAVITCTGTQTAYFQHFAVRREIEHEDYVPAPVRPKGEEDYTVGINICSLWQNGRHFGWSCISPFDDIKPALGYYDEGLTETADWEIKYMVEHGIDFQAFCIYAYNHNGVRLSNADHLFNAYQNAKYADEMKYTIIWECANAHGPDSLEAWKKDWVPFFIENFFKDERFLVLDNKPVIYVFGESNLAEEIGGEAVLRQAFDYLEEQAVSMGFDGVLYIASLASPATNDLADMGFDGTAAYNWGTEGYQPDVNKSRMLANATKKTYAIPTVSVGFNNVGWSGSRKQMMTVSDYRAMHDWVKSEYLPAYAKEPWQKNLVMLSTWNEYGEGTYIMPTADERGFGYIDAVREAYTDEKTDASVNTVPSDAQMKRIHHLYPQQVRLLRKTGYGNGKDSSELKSVYTLTFDKKENVSAGNMTSIEFDAERGAHGISGGDALMDVRVSGVTAPLEQIPELRVTCQAASGEKVQIFFATETQNGSAEDRSFIFYTDSDEMKEYVIPTIGNEKWTGKLTAMRIDPVDGAGKSFAFKSIEFMRNDTDASKTIRIDGNDYLLPYAPEKAANGDMLIPFDPAVGLDFALNTFYRWDKASGALTLNFKNHTLVYTVGSDKYTLDGAVKSLGYALPAVDGLPMIPIARLCREVGYTYVLSDDQIITVTTPAAAYFNELNATVPGAWEFNHVGKAKGWTSERLSIIVADGYASCDSLDDSIDPLMTVNTNLYAVNYNQLTIRARADWNGDTDEKMQIFFITNTDKAWSESKAFNFPMKKETAGEWNEYTIKINNPSWKGQIVGLRFDPFNAVGHIDIDYIRFDVNKEAAQQPVEQTHGKVLRAEAKQIADASFLTKCTANSFEYKDGLAVGTSNDPDPIINFEGVFGQLNADDYTTLRIGMNWDQSVPAEALFLFTTVEDPDWLWEKRIEATRGEEENGVVEFVFDLTSHPKFTGTTKGLRFDPVGTANIEFAIAYIEFEGRADTAASSNAGGKVLRAEAKQIADASFLTKCTANSFEYKDGLAVGTSNDPDPIINFEGAFGQLNADDYTTLRIGMKWDQSVPAEALFLFTTVEDPDWLWEKRIEATRGKEENGVVEFVFDLTSHPKFTGTTKGLRFDPVGTAGVEFGIAYIELS